MNSPEPLDRVGTSFSGKLKQAILVSLRLFLFCASSLVAVSALAWCVFLVFDPAHSTLAATQRTLGFIRIPFGVTVGLCIFFAAVAWDSDGSRQDAAGRGDASYPQIAHTRPRPASKREVS